MWNRFLHIFFLVPPGHYFLNTCNLWFWTCWSYTTDSFPFCFSSLKADSQLLFEEEYPKYGSTSKEFVEGLMFLEIIPATLIARITFWAGRWRKDSVIQCKHSDAGSRLPAPAIHELGESGTEAAHHTPLDEHLCAKFLWLHVNSWQPHVLIMITKLPAKLLQ